MKQLIAILLLGTLGWQQATACTCEGVVTLEESFDWADAIFVGRVIKKRNVLEIVSDTPGRHGDTITYERPRSIYTLQVSKIYTGTITTDTIEVITGTGDHDCGFNFQMGYEYIVYAKMLPADIKDEGYKKLLNTNQCTRTWGFNKDEDQRIEAYIQQNPKHDKDTRK